MDTFIPRNVARCPYFLKLLSRLQIIRNMHRPLLTLSLLVPPAARCSGSGAMGHLLLADVATYPKCVGVSRSRLRCSSVLLRLTALTIPLIRELSSGDGGRSLAIIGRLLVHAATTAGQPRE